MGEAVEEGGVDAHETCAVGEGSAVEGVLGAVLFEGETEAELVGQARGEGEVGGGGKDFVAAEAGPVGDEEVGGLGLVDGFVGVAGEEGEALADGLIEAEVVLVGGDVVAAGVDVVIAEAGEGSLDGLGVADVGVGVEGEEGGGAGTDGGEPGAGKRLACGGVVEGDRFLREVALLHALGGDEEVAADGLGKAQAFIGGEEEAFVVAVIEVREKDRTADGAAEIVGYFFGLGGLGKAEGDGIEAGVLEVPEGRAVELIGSGFGDGGDLAGLGVLGVIAYAVDADFGDGFGGREGVGLDVVGGEVLGGDAVDGGFGLGGKAALDGKFDAGIGRGRGSRREAAGVGLDAGEGLDDIEGRGGAGAAVVGGEIEDVAGGKSGGDGGVLAVDGTGVGSVDLDGFVGGGDGEGEVQAELLAGVELDAALDGGGEAGLGDADVVGSRIEVKGVVEAGGVGGEGAVGVGFDAMEGDAGVGDGGVAGVLDLAGDGGEGRLGGGSERA